MTCFMLHFVLPTSEPQDGAEAKGVGKAKEDLMKEGPILLVPLLWLDWIQGCTELFWYAALSSLGALGHHGGPAALQISAILMG